MDDTTIEYDNLNCITVLPNAAITSDAFWCCHNLGLGLIQFNSHLLNGSYTSGTRLAVED